MHFPTWVDLKGEDAVPETVHHVVVMVDPQKDKSWQNIKRPIRTDGVHREDSIRPNNPNAGKYYYGMFRQIQQNQKIFLNLSRSVEKGNW